jgi:uncharacterized membrane protein YphA (DoxX/SURF4 family)
MAGKRRAIPLKVIQETFFCNSWLELISRWVLGTTFIYASFHKIIAPADFAKIIYGYYLFPDLSINLLAITIPLIEIVAGLALILGIYPRSAALIINIMLVAFIIALSINLIRGQEFDCGCFTFIETEEISPAQKSLIRDIVLLIFGIQVLFYDKYRRFCCLQSGGILKNIQRSA